MINIGIFYSAFVIPLLLFTTCPNREMDGPDFLKNHNMFQFASGMTGSLQCRLTLHHIRYCWGEKIQAKHVSGEVTKGTSKPGYLNLQENLESTKVGKCGEVAAAEFGIPLCSHLWSGWASCQSHLLIRNTSQRSSHQLDGPGIFPFRGFLFFCDLEGARGFIRGMSSYKLYIFPFKNIFASWWCICCSVCRQSIVPRKRLSVAIH